MILAYNYRYKNDESSCNSSEDESSDIVYNKKEEEGSEDISNFKKEKSNNIFVNYVNNHLIFNKFLF